MSAKPYRASASDYLDAGWSPIPLPPGKKFPPPTGFTGKTGMMASRADAFTWYTEGEYETDNGTQKVGNVALRLPPNVLGIDVDHYGTKTGADSIAEAEAELGPLPRTWIATSRPDTASGIRLYRVPEGLSWRGLADVDAIHHSWRYVVAPPSIHPTTGNEYVWITPDGELHGGTGDLPSPATLPELPAPWVKHLSGPASATSSAGSVDLDSVGQAIAAMPKGEPCGCINRAAGKTLTTAGGRHDSYLRAVLAVLGHGRRGCPGAAATLQRMRAAFVAEVTSTGDLLRTPEQAASEWSNYFTGAAIGDVLADPQGSRCLKDPAAYGPELAPYEDADSPDVARRMRVLEAADELRIREEARDILAAERAANAYDAPPVLPLEELIAITEAETVSWRWEGLAEISDRLLIEAAAKTGKSTLMLNLVRSLIDGTPLLDHFTTTGLAHGEVLLYIDTELGRRKVSRWLAEVLDTEQRERVLVWSITGKAGSLDPRKTDTRKRMASDIEKALDGNRVGYAIVDVASAWTAALGIDENSNADVRGWLESVHALSLEISAEGLAVAHHTGHSAERSRGASAFRDWPDVFATLTRGTEDNDTDTRYISATGRDVDVPETALSYDHTTRRLSLAGGLGLSRKKAALQREADGYLAAVVPVATEQPGLSTRALRDAVIKHLSESGVTVRRAAVGTAITTAKDRGLIKNLGTGHSCRWVPTR